MELSERVAAIWNGKLPPKTQDVAREAGVSLPTARKVRRGQHVTRRSLEAVARVFGVEHD